MTRQNVRVVIASEYPGVQCLLKSVVAQEGGAATIGEAKNTIEALALTRNLRPDVVIIDSDLPHIVGFDTLPLSRISGLDAAQTISEEMPNTQVIFLSNLDEKVLPGHGVVAFFYRETIAANITFTLQSLCYEAVLPSNLIFANVEVKPRAVLMRKVAGLSGKDALFGGLSILGGLSLILTLILASAWILITFAGAATIGIGVGLLWKKLRGKSINIQLLSFSKKS